MLYTAFVINRYEPYFNSYMTCYIKSYILTIIYIYNMLYCYITYSFTCYITCYLCCIVFYVTTAVHHIKCKLYYIFQPSRCCHSRSVKRQSSCSKNGKWPRAVLPKGKMTFLTFVCFSCSASPVWLFSHTLAITHLCAKIGALDPSTEMGVLKKEIANGLLEFWMHQLEQLQATMLLKVFSSRGCFFS